MALEITGKLIQILPLQSGISKSGSNWQKQEFVIETIEQFPKKICANLWGDRTDILNQINIGDTVIVSFTIESREFNSKWYTDVKAYKIEVPMNISNQPTAGNLPNTPAPTQQSYPQQPAYYPPQNPAPQQPNYPATNEYNNFVDEESNNDLPF